MVNHLIDLIFPNRCFGCEVILPNNQEILCISCLSKLPFSYDFFIDNNPLNNKISQFLPVFQAFSLFNFTKKSLSRTLIHELKYKGKTRVGSILGEYMAAQIKDKFISQPLDGIVFIPTSSKKKRNRGYNQVENFAKAMSAGLQVPIIEGLIIRNHNQKSQVGKNANDRFQNLKNAFEIKKSFDLNKKHILLLDDVFTTGATMSQCMKTIQNQYEVKFSVAVIAYNK
jgi:ComF family protein